ncbi:hypothetical protein [Nocardioides panaciterrulae]|uniref:Uncharacterized protein n=1 Tax=Nocardioides panaciterrulae TaxID=661492 RepID=A0A7Y9JAQ1_9ACTN|nr:hypothetical protein [Nocardioides panaciterrulae]NYD41361.1 hypothetical protein [Nocardioides panaciterrulae]
MTDSSNHPDTEPSQGDSAGASQGVTDDQLPDDVRPGEDNPLAEGLEDDVDTDELDVLGGKGAEQWDEEQLED